MFADLHRSFDAQRGENYFIYTTRENWATCEYRPGTGWRP